MLTDERLVADVQNLEEKLVNVRNLQGLVGWVGLDAKEAVTY